MTTTARRAVFGGLALASTVAILAGCASAPESDDAAGGSSSDFVPCMVSDAGGFDDKSFNQLGYEGLTEAAETAGAEAKTVESADETVYDANLSNLADQGCGLIVTVGFALADATKTAAEANTGVNYATIDDASITADNVKPITFNTSEAAFLAGYAAASYSKSGTVGTFGGMQFPTVTIFMDGFADGVEYYNEQKSADVKVVGWDVASQTGTFTGGFEAGTTAKQSAQTLIDQGADVILPVGGPIYQSAAEAIRDSGSDVVLVGADSDTYETDSANSDLFLTSVLKGIKQATNDVVTQSADGSFSNEPYVGTLENDGVGIAPFHDYEDKIDAGLQDELDTIKAGIIDGSIEVESPSALS
ncbi:BMP family ABC transporter substrate-binding protein [Frigoribacterium sp. NBH87]|uniref:BMP family lipoprotein n=1 Tax=Frigoribacterium sp. NBH87 TaxID=2596916 RepID=UPI0016254CCC|nr:BMP family ABC transporter substrate-binding protein [Frigoribacterium sp. NBH87]QNE44767.1 BMP family ABC transporter substrate-binding protein [Frigoribacterium sp. NBH87]